jgi:hypothetical protein
MANHFGQQAVVIGGSLAGLMTARVLADHFEAVTVLERDHIDDQPELHQSIAQGHHLHGLLLGGQRVMAKTYAPNHYVHIGLLADWRSGTPEVLEPESSGPWEWYDVDHLPQPLFEMCRLAIESYKTGRIYYGEYCLRNHSKGEEL